MCVYTVHICIIDRYIYIFICIYICIYIYILIPAENLSLLFLMDMCVHRCVLAGVSHLQSDPCPRTHHKAVPIFVDLGSRPRMVFNRVQPLLSAAWSSMELLMLDFGWAWRN